MKKKVILGSLGGVFVLGLIAGGYYFLAAKGQEDLTVQTGYLVSVEYTLADENGAVIESTKGKQPMVYTHGQGELLPGLEQALSGMKVDDEKKVRLQPENAYGTVDPKAFQEFPRERVPEDILQVDTLLIIRDDQGNSFPARIHKIKEKSVVLDFNHPLAGKALSFDIKILGIQPPGMN